MIEDVFDEYKRQCIEKLASEMQSLQSFDYRTLDEAKKTVSADVYSCTFDGLSLSVYSHNLLSQEYRMLGKTLEKYWNKCSSEICKERRERAILFRYLRDEYSPFHSFIIKKENRPDFVLQGNCCIGIEITELTTPMDKVLQRISKDHFRAGLTADQIKRIAIAEHGRKAEQYSYTDLRGIVAVGSPSLDINARKRVFANQIKRKHDKYQDICARFDGFYILADAQLDIGITMQSDADDVYELLKEMVPSIDSIRVVILWNDGSKDIISEYRS